MKRRTFIMRRITSVLVMATLATTVSTGNVQGQQDVHRLPVKQYVDKMKAGWLGQMAGVGWGGPTEWRRRGEILSENEVPAWKPGLINQFHQDDVYVEMTFLRALEVHGMDVSIRQAGNPFPGSSGFRCRIRETRPSEQQGVSRGRAG